MAQVLLYTKKINAIAKDGKRKITFDKYLVSYKGKRYEAIIENDLKPRLKDDMENESLKFPLLMTLVKDNENNDYFVKHERYTRNDNSTGDKDIIVIHSYRTIKQGEFDNPRTLDDLQ